MADAGQYQPLIEASAAKYGIDPAWLGRLINQESRFNPKAVSPAGAQGIAQFMPATAKRYGVSVNDPNSSIEGAAHYLSDNLKLFGGNVGLATAAYNWGEGNVQKWMKGGGSVPAETQAYVNTITGRPVGDWRGAGGTASRLAVPAPATPGTTLNSSGAPATAPGAAPAVAGAGQPAQAGGLVGQLASALKPLSGSDKGGGGGAADELKPMQLQQAQPAQAMGGPMMMGPGGQNFQGRSLAANDLAQRGFSMQPQLASYYGALGATRPAVAPMIPGQATGMPGLMGTTLNSPSQLQMAMMSGQISPYDYYANAGSGGGGFGST